MDEGLGHHMFSVHIYIATTTLYCNGASHLASKLLHPGCFDILLYNKSDTMSLATCVTVSTKRSQHSDH